MYSLILPIRNRQEAGKRSRFRGAVIKIAAAAGIAGISLAYYALIWRKFTGVFSAKSVFSDLFSDFVIYYYPMGEEIFKTGLPVEGFLYSPFSAILYAVFPPLGLNISLFLWGILQVVFVVLLLPLFRRIVPAGLPIQLLFLVLVLTSYPVLLNFMGGQVSVLMIAAILGMLVFAGRGHRAAAALLLAIAVGFKFYPVIFIVPFAARRDGRMVFLAAAACIALLVVVPVILLGAGDTMRFYGALLESFRESDWVADNPHSNYLPHVVVRLAGGAGEGVQALFPLLRWVSYAVAAANTVLILLLQRSGMRNADLWSFQLVFLTIPFVLKTSWPHDFVFLSLTQAILAWRVLGGERTGSSSGIEAMRSYKEKWLERIRHGPSAATFFLLLASIAFSNVVLFNLFRNFSGYGFLAFLFWADLALLIALYLELLPEALLLIHTRSSDQKR